MLKALEPNKVRGRSLKLVTAWERNLMCQANGCQTMFVEQKKVNRHARICHPVEVVVVQEGTGAGPGAAATKQVRRQPANSVLKTWTGWCTVIALTGSRMLESAQNVKCNNTGLAVPLNPNTPHMVADVKPPLPNPTSVRGWYTEWNRGGGG
jgi:hypothetical protein